MDEIIYYMACPHCRTFWETSEPERFCPNCGKALGVDPEPQPPIPNPTENAPASFMIFNQAVSIAVDKFGTISYPLSGKPLILHAMEVAAITSSISPSQEVWAAAILHSIPLATGISFDDIRRQFGNRIIKLAGGGIINTPIPQAETVPWEEEKKYQLSFLTEKAYFNQKVIALAEALSELRFLYSQWSKKRDMIWESFIPNDKAMAAWYYFELYECCSELWKYSTSKEYSAICHALFGDSKKS